jgi:hypothetical protein
MTEKVLQEIRFIETDEGFRIEVNGDKEQLKAMGFGPGMFGFGRGFGRRQHGKPGAGRHMRRRMRHMHNQWHSENAGPWKMADDVGAEKSPKDV